MFRELLRSEYEPWGELSPLQLDTLERHYQLLQSWNRRLNLTRIQDVVQVVRFHYCESLFVSSVLPGGPLKICDLGSGAGFPGIPLAVIRPDIGMVLLESDQRKAVFLREATRDLKNIKVLATRHQECKMEFDWVVLEGGGPWRPFGGRIGPESRAPTVFGRSASRNRHDKVALGTGSLPGCFT